MARPSVPTPAERALQRLAHSAFRAPESKGGALAQMAGQIRKRGAREPPGTQAQFLLALGGGSLIGVLVATSAQHNTRVFIYTIPIVTRIELLGCRPTRPSVHFLRTIASP